MKLKIAHTSLEFKDSNPQHTADFEKIFSQGYDLIGGTEAGPGAGNTNVELKRLAKKHGYKINVSNRYDTWVAVKASLITRGSWRKGAVFVMWRQSKAAPNASGRWGDKSITWASFRNKDIGRVSVGSVHPLTKKGGGPDLKRRTDRLFGRKIAAWFRRFAKGSAAIAFVTGDFNLVDAHNDLFHGAPITSCWDELGKYPNTGHGNIDAVGSADADGRVKCLNAFVLDDKDMFMFGDHFVVVTTYEVGTV